MMDSRKQILLMMLFIISLYTLFSKLLWPSTLEISYINATGRITNTFPSVFSYAEALLMVVAGVIFGASVSYLLYSQEPKVFPKGEIKGLSSTEKRIYDILSQKDGLIFQNELLTEMGIPKSTLTVTLDRMDAKKILRRERRGMSNVVVLLK